MDKEEYERYIDEFLTEGEKDIDKVKIAAKMYDIKQKYESKDANPLLDDAEE